MVSGTGREPKCVCRRGNLFSKSTVVRCVPLSRQQKLEVCVGCAGNGGAFFVDLSRFKMLLQKLRENVVGMIHSVRKLGMRFS